MMDACVVYLNISVFFYPLIAVYDAGAAVYRSMGNVKITYEWCKEKGMVTDCAM